jgi:hypothetical protein
MGTNTPSVIQVRSQDVLPSAIGDVVLRAIRTAEPHLEAGTLVTVHSFRHRIRLLPIRRNETLRKLDQADLRLSPDNRSTTQADLWGRIL